MHTKKMISCPASPLFCFHGPTAVRHSISSLVEQLSKL